jgi:anaerobic selenocysteine-containing dehydrogenase
VKESFRPVHALQAGSTVDADFDAFYRKVTAAGGWWNPSPAAADAASSKQAGRPASTPSRITFAAPVQMTARAYAGEAAQMPYLLHVFPSAAFADGRFAHLPWLQELPDPMTSVMWGSWVEVSTETAHKLDIHEGDVLTIRSLHGSIDLPAFIYPGLRPDVIAIPAGQGHTQYGRYATRGANPLQLAASTLDSASGSVVRTGVRVRVTKSGRQEPLIRFGASDARGHGEHELHR